MHHSSRKAAATRAVSPPEESSSYKWLALSCTSLGGLMATLNGGTLIIALPDLMKALHAGLLSIVWVLIIYQLVQTVVVLTAGRIADMIGRKTLYVAGFALFGVSAAAAGFASNAGQLIVARAVQGAAGAFMVANSSAIVTDAFPKKQLGLALGTNMIIIAAGAMLGTILGGWLVSLGWRWVFWFNIPLSLIGTVWAAVNLREQSEREKGVRPDFAGTLTYMVAMTGLLVALTEGGFIGWGTPVVIVGLVAALAGFAAFARIESRAAYPMIDVTLFRHHGFTLGNIAVFLSAIARNGVTFLFVLYFQGPLGYDALRAGLLLLPYAASMLVVSPIAGILADRTGSRGLTIAGLAVSTVGLAGMAFIGLHTAYLYVALTMVVLGIGSGLFNSPNTRTIMMSVPPHRRGIAAGTRSMLLSSGGVVSTALVLVFITSRIDPQDLLSIFTGVTTGIAPAAQGHFISGLRESFAVMVVFSLLSLGVGMIPHQGETRAEEEATS